MRATPSSARPKSYWGILCAAMLATAAMLAVPAAHAQSTTTTSLQISNSPVSAGTAVTLYALVNNGSVTSGTVTFCDVTTFTFCDSAVAMGTAQLYSSGTAGIKFVPGIGVHTYEAVFNGTTSYSSSTSPTRSLTVVPTHPTTTSISSSGSAGNYIISGSISGPVDPPLFQMPGGTVTFVDQNSGNTLASAGVQGTSFSQSFNQTASPSTGSSPIFTVVGDFNGDGIPDQAIANYGSSSITILLGNGDGTFTQATGSPITVGSGPSSIAVGDFANNGKLDLAVTNFGTSTVTILLGAGDGTFTQATGSPYTVGTNPTSVAVGDFNRDGNLDLAVANYSSSNISVLTGNGSGGFTVQSSPPATGAGPITVVAGDCNGDGKSDLVTLNTNGQSVTLLLGNGNATFQTASVIGTPANGNYWSNWEGGFAPCLVVGDFNGDGYLDVAVADPAFAFGISGNSALDMLMNNGAADPGTFTEQSLTPNARFNNNNFTGIATGDFNGDGNLDLLISDQYYGFVYVLFGTGSGGFYDSGEDYYVSNDNNFGNFAVADFNGDGNPDFAMAMYQQQNNLFVFLNSLTESTSIPSTNVSIPAGAGSLVPVAANFSGTTHYASSTSNSLSLNSGPVNTTLSLTAGPTPSTTSTATSTASTYGQSVTLTATLSPYKLDGQSVANTETVIFKSGTTTLGSGLLVSGVATYTSAALPAASYTNLTAVYSGDTNFNTSTSNVLSYTVNPAPLLATIQSATKVYGAANPAFTMIYSGFVNGDTSSVVTGTASFSTAATAASGVGSYPITAANGTLTAANYAITISVGSPAAALTITQAPLTGTVQNATKVYGAALPAFALSYTGFVNGDTSSVISGAAVFTTNGAATSAVGSYSITATIGTLAATNYAITVSSAVATLAVTAAPLTATIQSATKVYGAANPTFALSYTGFVNGDTVSVVSGTATFTTSATAASAVGTYQITATNGTLTAANYAITISATAANLTITAAPLTATVQAAAKVYGAANPSFGLAYSGFVNGDTSSVVTGTATFTTGATTASGVGSYGVTATTGTLAATNYTIAFVAGTLTVTQAPLTATVQNATKVYGAALPAFALSYTGFVNGDTSAVVSGTASFSTSAAATSPVGTYSITATNGTLAAANYAIAISPSAGTLTITAAPLVATIQSATKVYGVANPTFALSYTGFVNGDTRCR